MDITSTYKHTKIKDHGIDCYNPNTIQDKLYFRDDQKSSFVPLTPQLFDEITCENSKIRF